MQENGGWGEQKISYACPPYIKGPAIMPMPMMLKGEAVECGGVKKKTRMQCS